MHELWSNESHWFCCIRSRFALAAARLDTTNRMTFTVRQLYEEVVLLPNITGGLKLHGQASQRLSQCRHRVEACRHRFAVQLLDRANCSFQYELFDSSVPTAPRA